MQTFTQKKEEEINTDPLLHTPVFKAGCSGLHALVHVLFSDLGEPD